MIPGEAQGRIIFYASQVYVLAALSIGPLNPHRDV